MAVVTGASRGIGAAVAVAAVLKSRSKPPASAYPVPTDVKPAATDPSNDPTAPSVDTPTSGS